MHFRRRCRVLLIALFAVTVGPALAQLDPLSEQLRQRVEQLREGRTLEIEGTRLAAVQFIPQFYERRGFQLAWTDRRNVEDLLGLINGTYEHGLDPVQGLPGARRGLRHLDVHEDYVGH